MKLYPLNVKYAFSLDEKLKEILFYYLKAAGEIYSHGIIIMDIPGYSEKFRHIHF